jgi:uncharacterized Tic20 family protein
MSSNSYIGKVFQPGYVPTSDEKTMAILAHILTLVAPILAPLIIYLVKKDDSQFVAYHAKESLNFQITLIIAVLGLLITVIGSPLIIFVAIAGMVLVVIATIRASEGNLYKMIIVA